MESDDCFLTCAGFPQKVSALIGPQLRDLSTPETMHAVILSSIWGALIKPRLLTAFLYRHPKWLLIVSDRVGVKGLSVFVCGCVCTCVRVCVCVCVCVQHVSRCDSVR